MMTGAPKGKRDAVALQDGLQQLAAELRREGIAAEPETPAFIRTLLGIRLRVPARPAVTIWEGEPLLLDADTYLKVRVCASGLRRYELATLPVNDGILIAWGSFWRGLRRLRRAVVTVLAGGPRGSGRAHDLSVPSW